jgi:hypothetical protein
VMIWMDSVEVGAAASRCKIYGVEQYAKFFSTIVSKIRIKLLILFNGLMLSEYYA